jgi:hypothetical protein
MSRYSVPAQEPGVTVLVGWDDPLTTFWAQVFAPEVAEEAEACVLWLGTVPQEIPTVAALQAQLAGWATLAADLVARLTHDQQAATPPTPLQRWASHRLHDAGEPGAGQAPPSASARPAPPSPDATRAGGPYAGSTAGGGGGAGPEGAVGPHRLTCGRRTSSCMASRRDACLLLRAL